VDGQTIRKFYDEFWTHATSNRFWEARLNTARRECLQYAAGELTRNHATLELHIGSGDGSAIPLSPAGRKLILLELSHRALILSSSETDNKHGVQGDAHTLPFRENSFEALYLSLVLMHLDRQRLKTELSRVLTQGGVCVVVEPLKYHPIAWLYRQSRSPFQNLQPQFLSLHELLEIGSNWAEIKHKEFYLLLPFLLIFARVGWGERIFFALLRPVELLDRFLLSVCPPLRKFSWMAVVVFRKL
jgi:SAM-dependent methyltransferase